MALAMVTLLACPSFADEVVIPFSISPETMIHKAKKEGIDLSNGLDADGFIKNEGMRATIYTYRSLSIEELETLKQVAFESVR